MGKIRRFIQSALATPNDPKLSDGGGWRAGCMVGGKAAAEAASVTAGAVRCSAWLGDGSIGKLAMPVGSFVVEELQCVEYCNGKHNRKGDDMREE